MTRAGRDGLIIRRNHARFAALDYHEPILTSVHQLSYDGKVPRVGHWGAMTWFIVQCNNGACPFVALAREDRLLAGVGLHGHTIRDRK